MKTLLDHYQCDCVFLFLMGLNDSYSNVCDQILLLGTLPPVTKVFSLIQQQERQHQMMSTILSHDSIALAIKKPFPTFKFPSQSRPTSKKDGPYYSHCKRLGYSL